MGLIGREIIQSRIWIDPTNPEPPNLNYKFTFPITVFDAVRRNMDDEESETLTEVLDQVSKRINAKQDIFPAIPANYLVTYAGTAGAIGSIQISKEIPWEESEQSSHRIPTEKAVGDLIRKLGIDPADPDAGYNIRWSDIIGRPNIYESLGNNENGFITQKGVTQEINALHTKIDDKYDEYDNWFSTFNTRLDAHINHTDNPHNITLNTIGAASADLFNEHIQAENPHNITVHMLGLDKVDNTSDMDKPISIATQEAIDKINNLITNMTDDVGELNFITEVKYNKADSNLELLYRNGSSITLFLPIEKSISDISYDIDTKELVIVETSGIEHRIDVSDLFIRYMGSIESNITITIEGDQTTGNQIIKASINPKTIDDTHIVDYSIINKLLGDQSVDTRVIQDNSITNEKYVDQSITTEKIAYRTIETDNLNNRIVTGRVLFSSANDYRILATVRAGTDPVWTQVHSDMIATDAIQNDHISKYAVTHDKIANDSISNSKIENGAVTTDKLSDNAVTTEKMAADSVTSNIIAPNPIFKGNAKIQDRPDANADNNEIPDTRWVRLFAKDKLVVETSNIANRSVTGEKLFSSNVKNRVLGVLKANQDPVWTKINNDMMDDNSVGTDNLIDNSVSADKLDDGSVETRHLTRDAVQTNHINESAVTSEKIYTSNEANRVLASLGEGKHPTYSQVTQPMIAPNAVGTMQLIDGNVSLSKIQSSDKSNMVMTVGLSGAIPSWSKIITQMVEDRAIDGSKLFTSRDDNVVLGLTRSGFNPTWIKITGSMIQKETITGANIVDKSITHENLDDKSIGSNNIQDGAIQGSHIDIGTIKLSSLETSEIPDKVIAVSGLPYSAPVWTKINSKMIEDQGVQKENIFYSKYPYHVLAATQAGVPPEYTMISHQFIVDGTIIPEKLRRDFVLFGTPELTVDPPADSNNTKLASTAWVRKTVLDMAPYFASTGGNANVNPIPNYVIDNAVADIFGEHESDYDPDIPTDTDIPSIDNSTSDDDIDISTPPSWWPFSDIPEHSIDGTKLFTHNKGPRVLGITKANDDVEFILIEEDLIVNGAVTTDKIQRSIHLLGSPEIEIRPSPNASDADKNGKLIPDCQWVIDRINDAANGILPPASVGGSGSGIVIPQASITSSHIQNRAVIGNKLFTTSIANRILGVKAPNTSPEYLQLVNDMVEDRAINGRTLFTSNKTNRVLIVNDAGTDPIWGQINSGMIGDNVIKNQHFDDSCITDDKIAAGTITARSLANKPLINETQIMSNSVTRTKIHDKSVTNSKIDDNTITGEKLSKDIVLPKNTSVENSRQYEQRSVRNITISPSRPTAGKNGDIWFRFATV